MMRNKLLAFSLLMMIAVADACLPGELGTDAQPSVAADQPTPQEPSNWEKFKAGAKLAGGAVASGAKNAAHKTAGAVAHGARETGEFFSDGYQDAKEYIHEKTE